MNVHVAGANRITRTVAIRYSDRSAHNLDAGWHSAYTLVTSRICSDATCTNGKRNAGVEAVGIVWSEAQERGGKKVTDASPVTHTHAHTHTHITHACMHAQAPTCAQ